MNVKWIKLTTNMFDDDKIKLIESMPEKDTVLIIWVKLLIQAGKTNASGFIYLNERIPYNDEMLAAVFSRPVNTVRMALDILCKFEMIERCDRGLFISNWEKHQNIKGLEELKARNAERVRVHRERKKAIEFKQCLDIDIDSNVTCNITESLHSEPAKVPEKKPKPVDVQCFEIPEALNTPEFCKAWEEWQQHRREIKKKLTPLAVKKQFNKLEKMGTVRAVSAINHSIEKGWQSINEENGFSGKKQDTGFIKRLQEVDF